jgi:HK97 family phage major capsid protein/HK97 family phage prohead protease
MSTPADKLPKSQTRELIFDLTREIEIDDEARLVKNVSVSSDEPYQRWFGTEILVHSDAAIDLKRAKKGATPLLYNHDRSALLGKAVNPRIEGGKLRMDFKFSSSAVGAQALQDVRDGILTECSIGYEVEKWEIDEKKDTYTATRWNLFEASLVTIPADATVGVGRSAEPEKPQPVVSSVDNKDKKVQTPNPMNPDALRNQRKLEEPNEGGGGGGTVTVEVVAEKENLARKAGETATRELFVKLQAITDTFTPRQNYIGKPLAELEREAFKKGMNETEYKELILSNWGELRQIEGGGEAPAKMGMSKKDLRKFSLCKLVSEMHGARAGGKGPTGLEKEVTESAASFYHNKDARIFEGFCIPHDVADIRNDENFDLNGRQLESLRDEVAGLRRSLNATVFSAGGALVGVDLLAGSFIDILRNAALIGQGPLGILELNGLVGNIAIPKQTSTTTVYWLAEGAAVTESQLALAQLALTPKRMSAASSYTKQLLTQASLSVEMLVRQDIGLAMGVEEDRVIINGAGGAEPLGIVNTTGVGANVTFSGAATWPDMVAFEYNLENVNVRNGQMAFLMTPLIKSYLKQTPVVAASTFPIFLWMAAKGEFPTINGVRPGIINEYPAYATKNAPTSNVVIFGVFNNNVTKARWGGFDVVLDPYTGAGSETIKFFVNQWIDVGIRYPQAFEVSVDAPTAS